DELDHRAVVDLPRRAGDHRALAEGGGEDLRGALEVMDRLREVALALMLRDAHQVVRAKRVGILAERFVGERPHADELALSVGPDPALEQAEAGALELAPAELVGATAAGVDVRHAFARTETRGARGTGSDQRIRARTKAGPGVVRRIRRERPLS